MRIIRDKTYWSIMRRFGHLFPGGYPLRFGSIVLVDPPAYMSAFLSMLRPFMSSKIMSRMSIVNTGDAAFRARLVNRFDIDRTLPALLGGSVIIEQIFSIPGMGRLGFEAVLSRDYPVVMAISTISAFITLASILITDIMYAVVDPRVTFGKR